MTYVSKNPIVCLKFEVKYCVANIESPQLTGYEHAANLLLFLVIHMKQSTMVGCS
jgi:hypothetical protein